MEQARVIRGQIAERVRGLAIREKAVAEVRVRAAAKAKDKDKAKANRILNKHEG